MSHHQRYKTIATLVACAVAVTAISFTPAVRAEAGEQAGQKEPSAKPPNATDKPGDLESQLHGYWAFDSKKMAEIKGRTLDPEEKTSGAKRIMFEFRKGELTHHGAGGETAPYTVTSEDRARHTLTMDVAHEDPPLKLTATLDGDRLTLKTGDDAMALKRISREDFEKWRKTTSGESEGGGEGITPLMRAAHANNIGELKGLIAKDVDVDGLSRYDWTALMFAAWKGHEEAVELLLDAGANPNLVSKQIARNTQAPTAETTALAEAIKNKHTLIAHTLLARGASADPISVAIAGGLEDPALLKKMHAKGADLNRRSGVMYYPSAMIEACAHGRLQNVKWLIKHGVRPDYKALASAVGRNQLEIVQYLIADAADQIRFAEQEKSTALVWAATKHTQAANYDRNLKIIEILLAHGANRDYRPEEGPCENKTALEFLKEQRVQAVERIERNRHGGKQQEPEKQGLKHRDTVIGLLEK